MSPIQQMLLGVGGPVDDGTGIVPTNLYLHLDAKNSSSYSGSGTTWTDLKGNNNITLSSSGISYDSTDGSGSIVFDGSNGRGTASISIGNIGTNGGSLEIWCKITDTSGYRFIGAWRDGSNNFFMLLLNNDGRMEARATASGGGGNVDIVSSDYGTSFWANNWNHIVLTIDRSDDKTRFYLNGSLVSTSSSTVGTFGTNNSFELMRTDAGSFDTGGKLSQVRVYSGKALSAAEVLRNYNVTKTRFVDSYSVDFDGSGDYITQPADSDYYDIQAQAFTVEYWIKADAFSSSQNGGAAVLGASNPTTSTEVWSFGTRQSGEVIFYYYNGSVVIENSGVTLSTGTWYHLALVHDGSNGYKIFIDGDLEKSGSISGSITQTAPFSIGRVANGEFDGKISDVRIVHSAVYTSSFSKPTTPLTAITNTKLLCCNTSTVTGSTVTQGTISATGDPTSSTDTPFGSY